MKVVQNADVTLASELALFLTVNYLSRRWIPNKPVDLYSEYFSHTWTFLVSIAIANIADYKSTFANGITFRKSSSCYFDLVEGRLHF